MFRSIKQKLCTIYRNNSRVLTKEITFWQIFITCRDTDERRKIAVNKNTKDRSLTQNNKESFIKGYPLRRKQQAIKTDDKKSIHFKKQLSGQQNIIKIAQGKKHFR